MQIGVSSYSYSRLVRQGLMQQHEVIAKAKEMGFDVLEFSSIAVPEGKTLEAYAHELRAEADRVGIKIANYTIGADFLNGSGRDWRAEAKRLQSEVQIARILGAPGMRHDATRGYDASHLGQRSFAAALPTLIAGCRAVTEYAADLGIRTMVENHGYFCQDSARLEQLADGVNHPNFGILIDIGNFVCADDDPARAVGLLLPYACHVHAKDFHLKPGTAPAPGEGWFTSRGGTYLRGAVIGHGDVAVSQCLRLMRKANYDGVLSIEFEGLEEPINGIRIGHDNLRRMVREIWA